MSARLHESRLVLPSGCSDDRIRDLWVRLEPRVHTRARLGRQGSVPGPQSADPVGDLRGDLGERKHLDRANRFHIAFGSAAEVAACLDVAIALSYLDEARVAAALALIDRVRAMTFRLSRG